MAATSELNIWVKLKDDASKALGNINSKLESMEPTFKAVGAAGAIGLGAISAVAIKSVRDFGEAEGIMRQLENTTINLAKGSMETVSALSALADEVQRKGVVDADAVRLGQAQLMTFQLSTEMVQGLTGAMADLAVNQFGVNASSDQMVQTANIMAKALRGEFGVLEKSGIVFTEVQKKMIQFGTEQEKISAMNEGLRQNLRMTNEVALKTMDGQLAKLNVTMGDISENIGAALEPAFARLFSTVSPLVDKFAQWSSENPATITSIVGIATALSGLAAGFGAVGLIVPKIVEGFKLMLPLFGAIAAHPIIAIVGVLALAFTALYTNSETFRNALNGLIESFTSFVSESAAFQFIMDTIKGAFEAVSYVVETQLWPALQQLWNTITTLLWPAIQDLWTALEPLAPYFEFLAKAIGVVLLGALWAAINAFTAIILVVTKVLEWITKLVEFGILVATDKIRSLTEFVGGLASAFGDLWNWIVKVIDKIKDFNVVSKTIDTIKSVASKVTGSKRAFGGSVNAGEPYIVGERGPEVLVPGVDGTIIPNMGGAGAIYNISFAGATFMGKERVAEIIGNDLVKMLQQNVKLP